MGKKALIVTTVSGFVSQFEMRNVRVLQELGYEVHYASNYRMPFYGEDNSRLDGTGIVRHQVDFVRSPFCFKENIKAFYQLRKLQKRETFDLVHCHTPMGGVLGRLVFGVLGKGRCKVLYTAHGFHFYKGAPVKNWFFYYPVEKFLSRWTDVLITINKEDYKRAKRKFHAERTEYVPGVGVDTERFAKRENSKIVRQSLGVPEDAILLLSVGELSNRKNHRVVIESMARLGNESLIYCICGRGTQYSKLKMEARSLGIENKVKFLGYREDVNEIYAVSDIFVFPSIQEGLPVALMEAMASGLPCIASDIRGNKDLIMENKGGLLFNSSDAGEFIGALNKMIKDEKKWGKMGEFNQKIVKKYDVSHASRRMKEIYKSL